MNKNSEIDLLELIAKVISFFKRRWLLIIIFVFAGMAVGYFFPQKNEKYFSVRLAAYSTVVPDDILSVMITSLQTYISDNNFEKLATELDISDSMARNIISIQNTVVSSTISDKAHYFTFPLDYPFSRLDIHLQVKNEGAIVSVKNGLIHYVENQNYVKLRIAALKKQNEELLNLINRRLSELKKVDEKTDNSGKSLMDVGLIEKRLNAEREISLMREIEFVENDPPASQTSSAKKPMIVYVFLFFAAGLTVSFILDLRKKVINYLNNKE